MEPSYYSGPNTNSGYTPKERAAAQLRKNLEGAARRKKEQLDAANLNNPGLYPPRSSSFIPGTNNGSNFSGVGSSFSERLARAGLPSGVGSSVSDMLTSLPNDPKKVARNNFLLDQSKYDRSGSVSEMLARAGLPSNASFDDLREVEENYNSDMASRVANSNDRINSQILKNPTHKPVNNPDIEPHHSFFTRLKNWNNARKRRKPGAVKVLPGEAEVMEEPLKIRTREQLRRKPKSAGIAPIPHTGGSASGDGKGASAAVTASAAKQSYPGRIGKGRNIPLISQAQRKSVSGGLKRAAVGRKASALWESIPTWGKAVGGIALAGLAIGAMNSHRRDRDRR